MTIALELSPKKSPRSIMCLARLQRGDSWSRPSTLFNTWGTRIKGEFYVNSIRKIVFRSRCYGLKGKQHKQ